MTVQSERADVWKTTVETLQRFYSIIVAIALTSALGKLLAILEKSDSAFETARAIALAAAFLSTIVPFYHGMERHLYETHRVSPKLGSRGRPFPLLADVFVFVIEGSLLFAMGRNLDDPGAFLTFWSLLLAVDIIWSGLVWFVQRGQRPFWAMNNLAWLSLAWATWLCLPLVLDDLAIVVPAYLPLMPLAIAGIEIGRSVTDYIANWRFYFPDSRIAIGPEPQWRDPMHRFGDGCGPAVRK